MRDGGRVAYISSAYAMRRSDKQADRVEIHPEQLSAAAMEAERLALKLQRPIQVLGWYHSHPHITVWPSHVDVGTQADYQLMDENFIGLIFSCFNDSDKRCSAQLICFQSYSPTEGSRLEYLQLPIKILPSPHSTLSEACVSALAHLPEILLEEEQESYATCQRYCENDLLTKIHNGAVYTQRLTHIQQVVCGPVIQTLEEQLQRTQSSLEDLRHKKTQLKLKLEQAEQTRPQKMNISEV
jgi:BRCA1/BRCA2-containing complex subunit 3